MTPRTGPSSARAPWPDGWALALLGLATAALLATDCDHAHWLQADRARVLAGELWRLVTGPLVASNTHRIVADLAVLALAGIALGSGWSRRRALLLLAALVLPTALALALRPETPVRYGLAHTAWALLLAGAARRACADQRLAAAGLIALGVGLHGLLPALSERVNGAMVLTAQRAGGEPYHLDTALPRLTCGPRALCWYVERQLGRPCDQYDVAARIWSRVDGTRIDALARELSRRAGRPHDAVELPPAALPCVVRCQPPIALVDVGWHRPKSHFVVVHRARRGELIWYDVNRGHRRAPVGVFVRGWRTYGFGAVVARHCLRRCWATAAPRVFALGHPGEDCRRGAHRVPGRGYCVQPEASKVQFGWQASVPPA